MSYRIFDNELYLDWQEAANYVGASGAHIIGLHCLLGRLRPVRFPDNPNKKYISQSDLDTFILKYRSPIHPEHQISPNNPAIPDLVRSAREKLGPTELEVMFASGGKYGGNEEQLTLPKADWNADHHAERSVTRYNKGNARASIVGHGEENYNQDGPYGLRLNPESQQHVSNISPSARGMTEHKSTGSLYRLTSPTLEELFSHPENADVRDVPIDEHKVRQVREYNKALAKRMEQDESMRRLQEGRRELQNTVQDHVSDKPTGVLPYAQQRLQEND